MEIVILDTSLHPHPSPQILRFFLSFFSLFPFSQAPRQTERIISNWIDVDRAFYNSMIRRIQARFYNNRTKISELQSKQIYKGRN